MFYLYVALVLLGKIIFGGYFIMNAYNHFKNHKGLGMYAVSKGVPEKLANWAVFVSGVMLLLGGLGVLLGFYVEIALLLLALFLIGVSFQMHQFWKVEDPMQKMGEQVNFYKNMALLGALFLIFTSTASVSVVDIFRAVFHF